MSDVLFQGPFPGKCVVGHVFANSWPDVLFLYVNTGHMCWGRRSCQNYDICWTCVLWVSTTRCKSQMYCTKTMERLDACVADPRYVGHRSNVLCVCPHNTHGHMCCKQVRGYRHMARRLPGRLCGGVAQQVPGRVVAWQAPR